MDRINGDNNIDIGGGRRGFRDRNAIAGLPGTELTAEWHNGIQEEMMTIIEAAGLTPDNVNWTQLSQALGKLYAPAKARYWTMNSPAGSIPASIDTRIANYANSASNMPASTVNKTAGTVTIGAADAGVYVVGATGAVTLATIVDIIGVRLNGSGRIFQSMQSPSDVTAQDPGACGILVLAAGDVVDASYYQTRSAGGSNTLVGGVPSCFFGARIGEI